MLIMEKDGGATHIRVTPDGIKFLAAFAACVSGGGPAVYAENLALLTLAPEMSEGKLTSWIEEVRGALFASEREASSPETYPCNPDLPASRLS